MDLVRLAVERGATAARAVAVLRALLASYPQGVAAATKIDFRYFSSFLVADRETAYVVETCGRVRGAADSRRVELCHLERLIAA